MIERLMGFKKDKITKLIEKGEESFHDDFKNNNLSFLDAHYKMQDVIEDIYNTNTFYYQELLNRKRFLTSFRTQSINLITSFIFGVIAAAVFDIMINISRSLLSPNPTIDLIYQIIKLLIAIALGIYVTRKIFKTANFISKIDSYNTNEFELKIINKKLDEFDNKRISK